MAGVATFVVYGVPEKQGSLRAFVGKDGRAFIRQGDRAPQRTKLEDWRHAVSTEARRWQEARSLGVLDEPVAVEVWFYLPRPKSAPRARVFPDRLPDVDKLGRAIGDALAGVVIADDARIVDLLLHKRYALDGRPRAEISIDVMDAADIEAVAASHPSAGTLL